MRGLIPRTNRTSKRERGRDRTFGNRIAGSRLSQRRRNRLRIGTRKRRLTGRRRRRWQRLRGRRPVGGGYPDEAPVGLPPHLPPPLHPGGTTRNRSRRRRRRREDEEETSKKRKKEMERKKIQIGRRRGGKGKRGAEMAKRLSVGGLGPGGFETGRPISGGG